MPYFIGPECDCCGKCEPECPADAISEGDHIYVIERIRCTDCGLCADICHVHAPYPDDSPRP